jgi:YD repeat-containing protein
VAHIDAATGTTQNFSVGGRPDAILASFDRIWVSGSALGPLASLNLYTGQPLSYSQVQTPPTALAYDDDDPSACTVDATGNLTHIDATGVVLGAAQISPAGSAVGCGEGWVWASHASPASLVRMGDAGGTRDFTVGASPVGMAFDTGLWSALSNGHVTMFDTRLSGLRVSQDIAVAPQLDGIVARENDASVWAFSKQTLTLYRISNTTPAAVTGTVVFNSPPVSVALTGHSVWVALQNGTVTELRY